jgi:hypothetical protein
LTLFSNDRRLKRNLCNMTFEVFDYSNSNLEPWSKTLKAA